MRRDETTGGNQGQPGPGIPGRTDTPGPNATTTSADRPDGAGHSGDLPGGAELLGGAGLSYDLPGGADPSGRPGTRGGADLSGAGGASGRGDVFGRAGLHGGADLPGRADAPGGGDPRGGAGLPGGAEFPRAGGASGRGDIFRRDDLDIVLRRFYSAAFLDPLIGPYFDGLDLDVHLPRIGDFWERALFRTADYRRDAFAPHAALHLAAPLTAEHFGRWVQLWHATVDGRHRGPNAERAKAQGERIALAMLRRLNGRDADTQGDGPGFIPLAALTLRGAA